MEINENTNPFDAYMYGRKQAKQEKAKEIFDDFDKLLPLDKLIDYKELKKKHCQENSLDKERISKKGNSCHLGDSNHEFKESDNYAK